MKYIFGIFSLCGILIIVGGGNLYSQQVHIVQKHDSNGSDYFKKCLESPHILHIAKKIYNYKTFPWHNSADTNYSDHDSLYIIADSLINGKDEYRLFYFHVLNEATDGADGAFMETLMSDSKSIIEKTPEKFYYYFKTDKQLGDSDLNEWAYFLCAELDDEVADGYKNAKKDFFVSIEKKLHSKNQALIEWYKPFLAHVKNDCK